MKCLHSFAMAIPLAAAMLFAQEPAQSPPGQSSSKTEKANQAQPAEQARPAEQAQPAQPDPSRTAGQADAGGKTYTGAIIDASCTQASALKPGSPVSANEKKDVLKHCQPTA